MATLDIDWFIIKTEDWPAIWDVRFGNKIAKAKAWEEMCDIFVSGYRGMDSLGKTRTASFSESMLELRSRQAQMCHSGLCPHTHGRLCGVAQSRHSHLNMLQCVCHSVANTKLLVCSRPKWYEQWRKTMLSREKESASEKLRNNEKLWSYQNPAHQPTKSCPFESAEVKR